MLSGTARLQINLWGIPVISSDPIGDALRSAAVAYWNMDEASGTRVDSKGANDLLQTDNPLGVTGKVGNAVSFDGTTQVLTCTSNSDLKVTSGQDYTWCLWVKLNSKATSQGFISKVDQDLGDTEYLITYNSGADRFELTVVQDSTSATVGASTFGAPSIGVFYFITCQYDESDTSTGLKISINNGAFNASSHPAVAGTDADFLVGQDYYYTGASDGLVDEVGFWKRLLTSEELTYLYNSGLGRTLFP